MLQKLFPKVHDRYSSLPILGPHLCGFAEFLDGEGYPQGPVLRHLRTARRIDKRLQSRGCGSIEGVTRDDLYACAPPVGRSQDDTAAAATVRLLERYLDRHILLPQPGAPSAVDRKLDDYANYLRQVRGLSASTIAHHRTTASQFIQHIDKAERLSTLLQATQAQVEEFVLCMGARLSRGTMQHVISQVRSFLRFLAAHGEAPTGLDSCIDTPRLYRGEQLPRALPWETVVDFLRSIDRSTAIGRRDYAIFLLITTYGLRASDIVGLRIDDIEWRLNRLCVRQNKSDRPLLLPLTDSVGDSLLVYLRNGRPPVPFREIFVRHRAPTGLLKPTAVSEAFQCWSRRSKLPIPFQGPHCLRHSYAVHLLRHGTSLKTIGDLLGHLSAESTCVYLRLALEDLRDVALNLPPTTSTEVLP